MFNSSLAQEMTAYIELRSAAFSDSLVSNDKRVLLSPKPCRSMRR